MASTLVSSEARGKIASLRRKPSRGGAYHWREYRIEQFLPLDARAGSVLLLGCGDAGERAYLERLGFRTLGIDIRRSAGADVVADAHSLPLQDGSFDVVLSMQVLEHLPSPWIAVQEISRVLRPRGWFVGSVAFMKPYHKSYFHMTHRGVRHLLRTAGLEADKFAGAQSVSYSIYGSIIPLGSRSVRRAVFGAVDRLLASFRVLIWSVSRRENPDRPTDRFHEGMPMSFRTMDRLRYAPAIVFRAQKKAERST